MGHAVDIRSDNFEQQIIKKSGVNVVDFGASWCGPCKALAPTIEELARDYSEQGVTIGKCDIEEAPDLAARFGIMSVPTIIFFKDGQKVDILVGNQPKTALASKIDQLLAP